MYKFLTSIAPGQAPCKNLYSCYLGYRLVDLGYLEYRFWDLGYLRYWFWDLGYMGCRFGAWIWLKSQSELELTHISTESNVPRSIGATSTV